MSKIEIRLNKETMLSGHVLTLSPSYVLLLGGIAEALVYSQIEFLTIDKKIMEEESLCESVIAGLNLLIFHFMGVVGLSI